MIHPTKHERTCRLALAAPALLVVLAACAPSMPAARADELSARNHDREAASQSNAAREHEAAYDPAATRSRERCRSRGGGNADAVDATDTCRTKVSNPTDVQLRRAEEHRRHAASHRAASAKLREVESTACADLSPDDRDISPFDHVEDILRVEPLVEGTSTARLAGATVTFRAVPGMTTASMQRMVDCHLARNATLGHVRADLPDCPLVPKAVQARVTARGDVLVVAIRSDEDASAVDVLARARRLLASPP